MKLILCFYLSSSQVIFQSLEEMKDINVLPAGLKYGLCSRPELSSYNWFSTLVDHHTLDKVGDGPAMVRL